VEDLKPSRPKLTVPSLVSTRLRGLRVHAAVKLDDQPQVEATKGRDAALEGWLAAELMTQPLTIPEQTPGCALSLGLIPPQLARPAESVITH